MPSAENLIDAVLEDSGLTLQQLAAICAVEPEWVAKHIEEGLLNPLPQQQSEWRFSSAHLVRVRRIVSLERNFEAVPELAALVADMQEEIDELRRRLYRAGLE
ncbi:chaperone modulator CbpM [Methylomonas albis]|uniref:MerR family transcriptional regulator n=1 Tax=Methylomonas albis TaxID=1854563 RepID=A0ABR9CVV4_9GAMM|nr:chaperone modulator CbpM [Methylomonas albis]MBD9354805.1 MerR family transcriptional regulator [Methylomonas albis]